MIKQTLALAFAATMAITMDSCNSKKTTPGGIEYQIINDVEGPVAKNGESISFHLIIRDEKDSVVNSTYTAGAPIDFVLDTAKMKGQKKSLIEGIQLLSVGDSADFFVPTTSLFNIYGMPVPPFIKEGTTHRVTVKMLKTAPKADQKTVDEKLIQEYIAANKLTAVPTGSGLYYVQTKPGTGKKVAKGDDVKVHYVGKLLTGMEFDSSVKRGEPLGLKVGLGQVIPGWDEGLQLMSEGEKGILLIPSNLGYGPQGTGGGGPIPPNAVLVFEVEIVSAGAAK